MDLQELRDPAATHVWRLVPHLLSNSVGFSNLRVPAGSNQSSLVWSISMQVLQAYRTNCPTAYSKIESKASCLEQLGSRLKLLMGKRFLVCPQRLWIGLSSNDGGSACVSRFFTWR